MVDELREKDKLGEFQRFVEIVRELREMLVGGGRDRLAEIEARLADQEGRLDELEQAMRAGKAKPQPEIRAVESGQFLGSLTGAVTEVQASLLAQPGPVRYAMGPVKAQIKAHLESDDQGQVKLHLPRPGVDLQELTLAQLDFSMVPLGSPEEEAEEILVPSVIGQPVELARRQVEASGLAAADVGYEDSEGPAGRVLDQSPRGGATLLAGGAVSLTVSRSRLVEVPNVVGGRLATAGKSLKAMDLRYRTTKKVVAGTPEGAVLAQEPAAGEELERRGVVKLLVASPPREKAAAAAKAAPKGRSGPVAKRTRKSS